MTDYMSDLEALQAIELRARFIVNNGGKWDETNSRTHSCQVVYRDARYIQRDITKWALTIREAITLATDALQAERDAGRAL